MITYSLDPKGERLPLEGVELHDPAYILLEDDGTIREARFYLDDSLVQTEKTAPYEFRGANVFGRPRPATFPDGPHTIRVDITRKNSGAEEQESTWFHAGDAQPAATGKTYPVTVSVAVGSKIVALTLTLSVDANGDVTDLA